MKKDTKKTKKKIEDEEKTIQPDEAQKADLESEASADEENNSKDDELTSLKEQVSSLSDKLIRTAAEFDNYKKRTAREKEDYYKSAICESVSYFLPVLDNLERALIASESNQSDSVLDGVKMIKKQFDDALSSIGVNAIDAVGKEFDPDFHNAVMMEESDMQPNTVIEEFQKGYVYKDKVVRHSMVKVSQ